jgi:hypothetical protein
MRVPVQCSGVPAETAIGGETMPEEDSGFAYFMLRVRWPSESPETVSGTLELLGTGEKQAFRRGDELLYLLSGWRVHTRLKDAECR